MNEAPKVYCHTNEILAFLKKESIKRGYTFEESSDGEEVKMIRSDGTIAMIARKPYNWREQ